MQKGDINFLHVSIGAYLTRLQCSLVLQQMTHLPELAALYTTKSHYNA